ncbi:MAG: hypothetical protein ABW139_00005, partial [Candidatus Thiodiazotropha sp. DIVDIV]
ESGGDLQDMVRQAIEDVVREQIGGAEDGGCESNGGAAAGGADDTRSDFSKMMTDMVMDNVEEEAKKDKTCSSGEGGGSKGNWLVMLAKAMSTIQGEHLNKMLDASDRMQKNTGEDEETRQAFLDAQGEFQAESKLFGMASEATATAIKSIGDGLSSIARKQ